MEDEPQDNHDNHEPETHEPPTPRPEDHAECRGSIHALSQRVDELENNLRTIISVKPDSTPVKGPWTHRKIFR